MITVGVVCFLLLLGVWVGLHLEQAHRVIEDADNITNG